jgi:hypothetical protein
MVAIAAASFIAELFGIAAPRFRALLARDALADKQLIRLHFARRHPEGMPALG